MKGKKSKAILEKQTSPVTERSCPPMSKNGSIKYPKSCFSNIFTLFVFFCIPFALQFFQEYLFFNFHHYHQHHHVKFLSFAVYCAAFLTHFFYAFLFFIFCIFISRFLVKFKRRPLFSEENLKHQNYTHDGSLALSIFIVNHGEKERNEKKEFGKFFSSKMFNDDNSALYQFIKMLHATMMTLK
jgi:hypothetical protein